MTIKYQVILKTKHPEQQRGSRKKAVGWSAKDLDTWVQVVLGLGRTGAAVEALSDLGVEWSNNHRYPSKLM